MRRTGTWRRCPSWTLRCALNPEEFLWDPELCSARLRSQCACTWTREHVSVSLFAFGLRLVVEEKDCSHHKLVIAALFAVPSACGHHGESQTLITSAQTARLRITQVASRTCYCERRAR